MTDTVNIHGRTRESALAERQRIYGLLPGEKPVLDELLRDAEEAQQYDHDEDPPEEAS